jgi:alkylation response protein AidB-like acyl-CoA dehydrogenase
MKVKYSAFCARFSDARESGLYCRQAALSAVHFARRSGGTKSISRDLPLARFFRGSDERIVQPPTGFNA